MGFPAVSVWQMTPGAQDGEAETDAPQPIFDVLPSALE